MQSDCLPLEFSEYSFDLTGVNIVLSNHLTNAYLRCLTNGGTSQKEVTRNAVEFEVI